MSKNSDRNFRCAIGFKCIPVENRILLSLPKSEYGRIVPDLAFVTLPFGKVLLDSDKPLNCAYFINKGLISLVAGTSEGNSVEIGLIGCEGILGIQAILESSGMSCRSIIQVSGEALRISSSALKRHFEEEGSFSGQILQYWQLLLDQVSQSAVCNRFHSVEQRLCRWLLASSDRVNSDTFPITHEFLSHMLGTNRATVTVAVAGLKAAGLISHGRNLISILNREGMEAAVCECYWSEKNRLRCFLKSQVYA